MAGENLGQLIDEVLDIVQDRSFRAAGTYASGTITLTTLLPSAGETVTIGGQVFTFRATRAVVGEITIGASVAACCSNIATAINTDIGTDFTAIAGSSTVTVRANYYGEAWNSVVFAESASNLTVSGSGTLAGGTYGGRATKIINQGLDAIAHRVLLPALKANATVTTSTTVAYVALPADFHRHLFRAVNLTEFASLDIYGGLAWLRDEAGSSVDAAGAAFGVAVEAGNLHYQYIPDTAQSLRLDYYKRPTALSELTDVPDCLPNHLIKPLLVNYACQDIFARIEDGVEGQKVNAAYHAGEYETAIGRLMGHLATATQAKLVRPAGWM